MTNDQRISSIHKDVEIYRHRYCSIFKGKSEVIVYGSGSDWVIQYANVTNEDWRSWYSDRSAAERAAAAMASLPYRHQHNLP